jgi:hypothetical protein
MMSPSTSKKGAGFVFILAAMAVLLCPAWSRSADCPVCPDSYETDDAFWQAKHITMNDSLPQLHNFHDEGDHDWVEFGGIQGEWYEMVTHDLGNATNTVLELYNTDGITRLRSCNDNWTPQGRGEVLSWKCPKTGTYFLKVRQFDPAFFGADTDYALRVYVPNQPLNTGIMEVYIYHSKTKQPLQDVCVQSNDPRFNATCTGPNGSLCIAAQKGTYAVTVVKAGFRTKQCNITIKGGANSTKTMALKPN